MVVNVFRLKFLSNEHYMEEKEPKLMMMMVITLWKMIILMSKEEEKDISFSILGKSYTICILTLVFNLIIFSQTVTPKTQLTVLTLQIRLKLDLS